MLFLFCQLLHANPSFNIQIIGYKAETFFLDNKNYTDSQSWWLRSRILAGANVIPNKNWALKTEFELANAQIWGDVSSLGTTVDDNIFRVQKSDRSDLLYVLPRELSVLYTNEKWGMNMGIQSFSWGLGILSNDGKAPTRFGATQQGNTYARLGVFTRPTPQNGGLMLFVATDIILRDDNAFLYEGDSAAQAIIGAQLIQKNLRSGVLAGVRYQVDRDDPTRPIDTPSSTLALPVDAFVQYQLPQDIMLEAEMAYIWGQTDRIYSESTRGDTSSIGSYGGITRISHKGLSMPKGSFSPLLEFGYASGDGHPSDAAAKNFSFHSDYNVSLLLYDEILPKIYARSVERLVDPELTHTPAPGLRYAVPQGGVHNSTYVQLCGTWNTENILVRGAWLHAYSTVPLADPYQTGIFGGYAKNVDGGAANRNALGNELNLRLQYTASKVFSIALDGGYFIPGDALSILDPTWMVVGQANIRLGGAQ